MGRILFSTCGARGDVIPYLAIGQELVKAGHEVVVATDRRYEAAVVGAGLEFRSVRPHISAESAAQTMRPARGSEYLFRRILLPELKNTLEDLRPLAREADVLVSHTTSFAGPILADLERERGLKWVSAVISPIVLFSGYDSPALPVAPTMVTLNPGLNRAMIDLIKRQYGGFLKPVDKVRAELGLPPGGNVLTEAAHSPTLSLALFSEGLQPKQPDWPASMVATGFCFLKHQQELPQALVEFLDEGEAPLLFLAGSFSHEEWDRWVKAGSTAASKLGMRAIFLGGDEFQSKTSLGLAHAPLDSLLPRVKAMIHHGGIGTFALGLRAAVPMLLLPVSHDQPDTARMAVRAGVAKIGSRKRLNGSRLAEEIDALLADEEMKERLGELRGTILREPGAAGAAALIGRLL